MNTLLYDSRDERFKSPFGAVPAGTPVTFRICLPMIYQFTAPALMMFQADQWDTPDRIPMQFEESDGVAGYYTCVFCPPLPQLYFYRFELSGIDGVKSVNRGPDGFSQISLESGDLWQLTVYDTALKTPDFMKNGVMYQIFPDRFCNSGTPKDCPFPDRWLHQDWYELPVYQPDSNGKFPNSDYFGGDLIGITSNLPYLKSLGVTCIYLNPIFEAHENHRYNTADYEKIDPLLGNEGDFQTLCGEAQNLGIRILLDGVFNHTGSDSVYFNKNRRYGEHLGAYNDPQSPYRSWYDFTSYPNSYRSWWGFETLPNLNESDPAYQEFICGENGVLKKWLRLGASGYRLDVADELPDFFLNRISACIKEHDPECAVIGEVWEDASTKISYGERRRYLLGGQLDSVMNYPFKDAILSYVRCGDCNRLYLTILAILENYPKPVLDVLMNSLSTHDVERAITALAGEPAAGNGRDWQGQHNRLSESQYRLGKNLFCVASVIQYTLPGIPCLYYGDEAGLYGYKDPFNRTCYPWGREDTELLEFFRSLGELRTRFPELSSAGFRAVSFTPETVSYCREWGQNRLLIAVNRTEKSVAIAFPAGFGQANVVLGTVDGGRLAPFGYAVLADSIPR